MRANCISSAACQVAFPGGQANSPNYSSLPWQPSERQAIYWGHTLMTMGLTFKECLDKVIEPVSLLESLGFIIHPDKSKFIPSQVITFLGFVIDSVPMKVYLTVERKAELKEACLSLLMNSRHTIRYVAKVIGLITASFPGVKFSPLHFCDLESCKLRPSSATREIMIVT